MKAEPVAKPAQINAAQATKVSMVDRSGASTMLLPHTEQANKKVEDMKAKTPTGAIVSIVKTNPIT